MGITVKKLAAMSGVSVRTLHYYDEVGLLKPADRGANGYRIYEEPQLQILQQILFYRELGFELKRIKAILARVDFDKVVALEAHRKVLQKNLARTRKLIVTVDKTIEHLKETRIMKNEELFWGFDAEIQAAHEQYLINRFGEEMREGIAQSKQKVKNWTRAKWENAGVAFAGICQDLVALMEQSQSAKSPEVQGVVSRHYAWLQQFWMPTRESYTGHGRMIVDSDLRKAYEVHHPQLPEFMASAIQVFAERELA